MTNPIARRSTRTRKGTRGRSTTPTGRRNSGVDDTPVTPGGLSSLTCVALRGILSARGVSYAGLRKAELIQACIESSSPSARKNTSRKTKEPSRSPDHTPTPRTRVTTVRGRRIDTPTRTSKAPSRSPARSTSRGRRTPARTPKASTAPSVPYSTGKNTSAVAEAQAELHHVRENMNLLHHPFLVFQTLVIVLWQHLRDGIALLFRNRGVLAALTLAVVGIVTAYHTPGDHQTHIDTAEDALTWIGLGILSSVGLGTGLHTFVLNLGPHIFMVAFTAYDCNSLDFAVAGPDRFICPKNAAAAGVTFWAIVRKVQWEALMWGAGTAIGELPPYFVARTARLSGKKLQELEEEEDIDTDTFMGRIKAYILEHTEHLNFFTIMLLASVPNPLFDLAGLTCGHLLVPFWTFFGATLIGKAVNKAHLQVFFVVGLANNAVVQEVQILCDKIPKLGQLVRDTVKAQHRLLHRAPGTPIDLAGKSLLARVWDVILFVAIAMFVLSIVTSLVRGELVARAEAKVDKAKERAANNRRASRR